MKMKYLAVILGALTFSQTVFATAPLCRSVLRSFTQEQINDAIEAFTNLSRYVDQLQVIGTTDAKYTSARKAQKAKELELLSTLDISRDELRRLVKKKNDAENINEARATREESKSREKQESLIRPLKAVLKKSLPINITSGYTQVLADNVRHLAIIGKSGLQMIDLVTGEIKAYDDRVSHQVGDSIFSFDPMTKEQMIVTNLGDGQRKIVPLANSEHIVRAEDRNSVLSYDMRNGDFNYVVFNAKGDVTYNGMTSINKIDMKFLKLFLGEYAILKSGVLGKPYYLLSLKTKNVVILPIDNKDIFSSIPGTNSLLIQDFQRTTFQILDLEYLFKTKHEFSDTTDVVYIDKDIAWVETKDSPGYLHKVDLRDLTAPKDQVEVGDWSNSTLEEITNTPFLMVSEQSSESDSPQLGIYRKKNLSPALILSELYAENKLARTPVRMLVSKDAKTMVVFSHQASEDPAKLGIEIWSLEKR